MRLQPQPALLNFELRDGVTELETPIDLLQAIVFNEFNPPLQGIAAAQPVGSRLQPNNLFYFAIAQAPERASQALPRSPVDDVAGCQKNSAISIKVDRAISPRPC